MGVTWVARSVWAPLPEVSVEEPVAVDVDVVAVPAVVRPHAEELLWKAIARDRAVQVRVLELLEECRRETGNG